MKALTCLVICLVTAAKSDHNSDMKALNLTDPTLTFEQISEIVNNPIYRESTPSRLLIIPNEPSESLQPEKLNRNLEPFDEKPLVPSAELEPPLETAQDVYGKYAPVSSTPLPIIVDSVDKPQEKIEESPEQESDDMPYTDEFSSEKTFMGAAFPPALPSRDLELPFPNMQRPRTGYPPVPSRELQTPLFEPYYDQYNDEEYVKPLILAQKPLPYRENVLIPIISDTLEPPKFLPSNNRHNPTKIFPKKYNSKLNEIKKKKVPKDKPVVELLNEDSNEDVKYYKRQNPLKLVEDPSIANARDESMESYLHKQALEKQRQMYEEAQLKKREKMLNEVRKQQQYIDDTVSQTFGQIQDPETSETELNTFHNGGKTDNSDSKREITTDM